MLPIHLAAAAAGALALAASGCGESSKTGASQPTAGVQLTRAQVLEKTDAICQSLYAKRGKPQLASVSDYGRYIPPVIPLYRAAIAELTALKAPASMEDEWSRLRTNVETFTRGLAQAGTAGGTSSIQGVRAAMKTTTPAQNAIIATAKHNGLTHCVLVF